MKKIAFCLLLLSFVSLAATYHVDAVSGDDTRTGLSPQAAFRTLGKASKLLKPGDTLKLAPGQIYYESLQFTTDGTPAKPIVVEGQNAILSGLEPVPKDGWKQLQNGIWHNQNQLKRGSLNPLVFNDKLELISQPTQPQNLKAGFATWDKDGIFFKCEDGKHPNDYNLHGTYKVSGVIFTGQSYIIVNDLICQHFANDGFNVHGYCRGLRFQNIVGRWNGDDGFSVHEDVEAVVQSAHLHHNDYGVQDINASRTLFFGIVAEDNRRVGIDFHGGTRSVEDSIVRNNGYGQINLSQNSARHLGYRDDNPMLTGTFFLKNVLVTGGNGWALRAGPNTRATVANCTFLNTETGLKLEDASTTHLIQTIVAFNAKSQLDMAGKPAQFAASNSVFHPESILLAGKESNLEAIGTFCPLEGNSTERPVFTADFAAIRPKLLTKDRRITAGAKFDFSVIPYLSEFSVPVEYTRSSSSGHSFSFDFESENPWCRTYIEPESKSKNVTHSSVLSDEQAASGKRSAKVHAVFPADPKQPSWLLKLFSVKFDDVDLPVTFWSFKLYGNNCGATYRIRVRDSSGEQHYGPGGTIDWTGWKTITWDLKKDPPTTFHGGDGNRIQNAPPVELVVDFTVKTENQPRDLTVYVDDLFFQIGAQQKQAQE